MATMTDYSLEYLELGFSVLPVAPESKRPLMRSWERFTGVRPEEDQLRNWFDHLTSAGVGTVTGAISNLVVVDVDRRSGMDYSEIVRDYPTDLISRTGSGGYHLFYRHPGKAVGNRVDFIPGVDLRGDGGFVVLPPTRTDTGEYSWVCLGAPGEYPEGLIPETGGPDGSRAEKWVSEAFRGVSEGGRNAMTARLAGYLFNKSMPFDIVESIIKEWNEKNSPPLPLREIETTLESVWKKHQRSGKSESGKTSGASISGGLKALELENPDASFDLVSMSKYFREFGGDGVQWAVDDWLADGSVVFLVSPPESYKTWILLDLAVSIASGQPFLGEFEVRRPGPVIIIQQEDSHQGITERMSVIMQSRLDLHPQIGESASMPLLPDLPIYIHPSRMLRFDDEGVMSALGEAIERIRPVCVIIDPLYSATKMDNYMADSTEDMFQLKKFRDRFGCSFVIAHHSKKNMDPDSTAREDGWGSQFLNAFLEAGWQVRRSPKLPENEVVVRRHSKTMGNMGMISVAFDISTQYPMKYEVDTRPYEAGNNRAPAQQQLFELLADGPLNNAELAQKTGKHKSTVSRQLLQLEMAAQIEKMPDGRYKVIGEP